jgi:hypothetical protein
VARSYRIVMAVWHIIIGGWIYFGNGKGWCIVCNPAILTVVAVISVALGIGGLVIGRGASNPMPG